MKRSGHERATYVGTREGIEKRSDILREVPAIEQSEDCENCGRSSGDKNKTNNMSHKYLWKNNEANFGKPIEYQIEGGMHITFEIILQWNNKYIGLRRASIPGHEAPLQDSHNLLYFCHDLIRYGESVDECVKRVVESQSGVGVRSCRVVYIDSLLQEKDGQWAFVPHVIADLSRRPTPGDYGNPITEVVEFTKSDVPNDFAWWEKKDLEDFLKEFDVQK